MPKRFCTYCGKIETPVWTGRYSAITGQKVMSSKCTNLNCEQGRYSMCPGHTRGFLTTHCKHCGYPMSTMK